MTIAEIEDCLRSAILACRAVNEYIQVCLLRLFQPIVIVTPFPFCQVVLTVSPVRHTRDGIVENSLSKSRLLCAAHSLVDELPETVTYFPAYEYMMDELRYTSA
jgi:hypothetical protein